LLIDYIPAAIGPLRRLVAGFPRPSANVVSAFLGARARNTSRVSLPERGA